MSKKQFVVAHPKLYLKVEGKMACVEKGTEISLDEKQSASLLKQKKILVKGSGQTANISDKAKEEKK